MSDLYGYISTNWPGIYVNIYIYKCKRKVHKGECDQPNWYFKGMRTSSIHQNALGFVGQAPTVGSLSL